MGNKHVYVMVNTSSGLIKVGMSNSVDDRAVGVSHACGSKVEVKHSSRLISNASHCEALSHRSLSESRCMGEWFNCSVEDAVSAVNKVVDSHGLDPAEGVNPREDEQDIFKMMWSFHINEFPSMVVDEIFQREWEGDLSIMINECISSFMVNVGLNIADIDKINHLDLSLNSKDIISMMNNWMVCEVVTDDVIYSICPSSIQVTPYSILDEYAIKEYNSLYDDADIFEDARPLEFHVDARSDKSTPIKEYATLSEYIESGNTNAGIIGVSHLHDLKLENK